MFVIKFVRNRNKLLATNHRGYIICIKYSKVIRECRQYPCPIGLSVDSYRSEIE